MPDTGNPVQLVKVPAEGVPMFGVTKVGLVANTNEPVPVSSVMAEIKLALEGVAKNVATPVPNPDTPVEIGKPVQLVNVPLDGVPRAGVTSVGLVANTTEPEPVVPLLKLDAAICEPLICTAPTSMVPKVPENTSEVLVASGMKVSFPVLSSYPKKPTLATVPLCQRNSTPRSLLSSDAGAVSPPSVMMGSSSVVVVLLTVVVVPLTVKLPPTVTLPEVLTAAKLAVPVNVGLAENTRVLVPVSSVMAEAKLAELGVAKKVAMPVPKPEIPVATGNPVQFVKVPEVGVPKIGVTSVGLVANTSAPEPVSSVTADAKLALDGVAKKVATPVPKPLTPELMGNPVQFVKVPDEGVPNTGVVNVGLVKVLLVSVCVAVLPTISKPPAVVPSWTRSTSKSVSTDISPAAPVKLLFCVVVPLLNCTCVGIYILLNVYVNAPKSVVANAPEGDVKQSKALSTV